MKKSGAYLESAGLLYGSWVFTVLFCIAATPHMADAVDGSWWLVSPELVERGQLKMLWQTKLPITDNEAVRELHIIGDRLYILSDLNHIFCLDRQKGAVVFSEPVAPAGFAVLGLSAYGGELLTVIGNSLVRIDMESGRQREAVDLDFAVACAPVRNSGYFYLSGADRRLRVMRADDKVQVFQIAAENNSLITSIVADEYVVIFGTAAGNVIAIAPDRPKKLWQFDAGGAVAGSVTKDGPSVFFASADTNVYRLDIIDPVTIKLAWKCQVDGILDRSPAITRAVVYQYAVGGGLTAIDRQSGVYRYEEQDAGRNR
jgi:outer membrane protein assembly factor BamB